MNDLYDEYEPYDYVEQKPCEQHAIHKQERSDAQAGMKIGIFRALQLGDLLCVVPAIRALRNYYPGAHITLIGLPWAASFVERFPVYFDEFVYFPGYPGLPEQAFKAKDVVRFFQKMQQRQFDFVLQMQGNGTLVNPMVELWGAKFSAGFFTEGHYHPNNALFMKYPEGVHEIKRHIMLMEHIGMEPCGTALEFPLYDKDTKELNDLGLPVAAGRYVCVHPGSRGNWRQWPVDYFAQLADYCALQGLEVVITGTKNELPLVRKLARKMKAEPIIAAGKTSLGAVAALIKNAHALIANCTGVSHIASALKTPSVIISMDGEPERWAPMDTSIHFTTDWTVNPDFDMVFGQLKRLLKLFPPPVLKAEETHNDWRLLEWKE